MPKEASAEPFAGEEVTLVLERIESGDPASARELLPIVYEELRRLARHRMAQEVPGNTLQATALVHEAYLRVAGDEDALSWNSRGHFFAAAAEAMRRILIDGARRKNAKKRGGGMNRVDLDGVDIAIELDEENLLRVDEALAQLEKRDEVGAQLVKLRFFTGLSNVEAAQLLGISERTGKRTWAYARAWLYRELKKSE